MAKTIIILGLIITCVGLIFYFFPVAFRWIGKLPGDIDIRNENSRVFIPLGTMLVLSAGLSVILYLISKFQG